MTVDELRQVLADAPGDIEVHLEIEADHHRLDGPITNIHTELHIGTHITTERLIIRSSE